MNKNRLILVDGHGVLYRAFYAFPYLTGPDGEMTNAIFGFTAILLSVIEDLEPTHICVAFDTKEPTFRKDGFEAYKAQRKPPPDEMIAQFEPTKLMVDALNIPRFELPGWEADDVIGTLSRQASEIGDVEVIIVTGDMDALQLVKDGFVSVYAPGRKNKPAVMYSEDLVLQKLGVSVDQVVDLKGLAGDASDNIPGVKGVGPKTAVKLVQTFGSVEGVYEELEGAVESRMGKMDHKNTEVTETLNAQPSDIEIDKEVLVRFKKVGVGQAVVKKLIEQKEMAFKSKDLATIRRDVPINLDLEACKVSGYNKEVTLALFDKYGFKSLVKRLPKDDFEIGVQEALF